MDMLASGGEADLEAYLEEFHRHMAVSLAELMDSEGFLSLAWIRRLLEVFLRCQEEFWLVMAHAARHRFRGWVQAEWLVVEYHQHAVKALDVCNAASHGVHEMRHWGRLAGIAASVMLVPRKIRRARKALSDLAVLLDDVAAARGGVASHCNRGTCASPARTSSVFSSPVRTSSVSSSSSLSSSHLHSHSWSVSRTWSAPQQLQAIRSGLAMPRGSEGALAWPVYAMGCMLHLVSWVLVVAVLYPDCGDALHAYHLPAAALRVVFPWTPLLLTLQNRLSEEEKHKDRHNSCGLLKETHALKKHAQRLAEAIDAAAVPLSGESETEVQEAAAELAAVCAAMKDGLEPLERQVREVFHCIVRSRMEGFDSPMPNAE
jgi:hypothetical protein